MPTNVTAKEASQSRSCKSPRVVAENFLISWRGSPPSPGVLTHAVIDALCTSSPAHRSTILFNPSPFPRRNTLRRLWGASSIESLVFVLVLGNSSGCLRLPRHTWESGSCGTKQSRRQLKATAPFSWHRGGPARAMAHWCENSLGGSPFSWFRGGPARAMAGVKIVSAAAHFHGFGVARQGPWLTGVKIVSAAAHFHGFGVA